MSTPDIFNTDHGPVLVVAPHPDDEVLGAGGTIARLADQGRKVHVAIVTRGQTPRFSAAQIAEVQAEARAA
ncbi:MAG: PIG-L family deacetylase, partial [Rhodobacteraceae bacterium]|nr:PIG-L family deacetylase [Paracoccaceae bacterium]